MAVATSTTQEHDRPGNGWTLDEIAATIINEAHAETVSRATVWRVLQEADLKPHKSVYWLNSHDADFEARAKEVCQLYVNAPRFYQQGRLVICCDEKAGMQILQRAAPTQRVEPGKPEKREFEYKRLGTRTLIASFMVPTGEVVWDLGPTRTSLDFRAHVLHVAKHFAEMKKFDWVVDNLNTHHSLALCEMMAYLNDVDFQPGLLRTQEQRRAFLTNPEHRHVFHYVPRHGSWLNQVELWFSVLSRQFLRRGDFASVSDFVERLTRFLDDYNLEKGPSLSLDIHRPAPDTRNSFRNQTSPPSTRTSLVWKSTTTLRTDFASASSLSTKTTGGELMKRSSRLCRTSQIWLTMDGEKLSVTMTAFATNISFCMFCCKNHYFGQKNAKRNSITAFRLFKALVAKEN